MYSIYVGGEYEDYSKSKSKIPAFVTPSLYMCVTNAYDLARQDEVF